MSNRHHVIQPTDWLTPRAWEVLEPMIDAMPADGGCITLVIDARPDCRNFITLATASFTGKERETVRKAIVRQREKVREGQQ